MVRQETQLDSLFIHTNDLKAGGGERVSVGMGMEEKRMGEKMTKIHYVNV